MSQNRSTRPLQSPPLRPLSLRDTLLTTISEEKDLPPPLSLPSKPTLQPPNTNHNVQVIPSPSIDNNFTRTTLKPNPNESKILSPQYSSINMTLDDCKEADLSESIDDIVIPPPPQRSPQHVTNTQQLQFQHHQPQPSSPRHLHQNPLQEASLHTQSNNNNDNILTSPKLTTPARPVSVELMILEEPDTPSQADLNYNAFDDDMNQNVAQSNINPNWMNLSHNSMVDIFRSESTDDAWFQPINPLFTDQHIINSHHQQHQQQSNQSRSPHVQSNLTPDTIINESNPLYQQKSIPKLELTSSNDLKLSTPTQQICTNALNTPSATKTLKFDQLIKDNGVSNHDHNQITTSNIQKKTKRKQTEIKNPTENTLKI